MNQDQIPIILFPGVEWCFEETAKLKIPSQADYEYTYNAAIQSESESTSLPSFHTSSSSTYFNTDSYSYMGNYNIAEEDAGTTTTTTTNDYVNGGDLEFDGVADDDGVAALTFLRSLEASGLAPGVSTYIFLSETYTT